MSEHLSDDEVRAQMLDHEKQWLASAEELAPKLGMPAKQYADAVLGNVRNRLKAATKISGAA